ncbi:MAG: sulfatase-like hydrolase/transferase [Elusimicrobiota bacterium]
MKNKKLLTIFAFIICNFILTLILGCQYFKFISGFPLEIFFTVIAHISNTATIYIIPTFFLFILCFIKIPFLKIVSVIIFFAINILAFVDAGIYRIFRFHINGLVLNIFTTHGGWESLGFSIATKIFFIFVIISLFSAELFLYNNLSKFFAKKEVKEEFIIAKKYIFFVFAILVTTIVMDKGIYAYSDLKNISCIVRHNKLFPLYQPLTIKKFAKKHFNIKIDEAVSFRLDKKHSGLNYPQKKLEFSKDQNNLPNIVLILIDSFRFDMLNEDITPNIYNFSKESLVFKNHYSGGNCTRFGVFSIFYGLYGYYWDLMLGERQPPVFMTSLAQLGYDFKIVASSELTFPEFNKTCFIEIPPNKIMDKPKADDKSEKDAIVSNEFINYIDKREHKTPFFAFLFFDCPHGSYDSPDAFQKFQPAAKTCNYLLLNKNNVQPVFNKYKNAVHYDDYLVGKVIDKLKKHKLLKNTVVIISSDHGEAFFEKGFYGHNHSFCEEQVKVPLVFYVPSYQHKKYTNMTSHLDILPTLMSFIGCKNSPDDYCQGIPLFDNKTCLTSFDRGNQTGEGVGQERKFVVSYTWGEMAIINNNLTAEIPFETHNMTGIKIYNNNYEELCSAEYKKDVVFHLAKLQKEITRFQK